MGAASHCQAHRSSRLGPVLILIIDEESCFSSPP